MKANWLEAFCRPQAAPLQEVYRGQKAAWGCCDTQHSSSVFPFFHMMLMQASGNHLCWEGDKGFQGAHCCLVRRGARSPPCGDLGKYCRHGEEMEKLKNKSKSLLNAK